MDLFARRPWLVEAEEVPPSPLGMLGRQEARLFHHLAKEWFCGEGAIVDAGSFLGCSAFHFAHGLLRNPHWRPGTAPIHCFDNFVVNEGGTIRFLRQHTGRDYRLADSTRELFAAQVAPVQSLLQVHEGDFLKAIWTGGAIEILMVDIAKSVALGGHVVAQLFPHLVPGHSLVVHQDYHHAWLPHVHVVMEFLAPWFELVEPAVDCSAVFRLRERVPAEVLARAAAYDFAPAEQQQLLASAKQRLPAGERHWLQLAQAVLHLQHGQFDLARQHLSPPGDLPPGTGAVWQSEAASVLAAIDTAECQRLSSLGDPPDSLALARDLRQRGHADSFVCTAEARALRRLDRHREALACLEQALAQDPRCGEAYLEAALCRTALGEHAAAEALVFTGLQDPTATANAPRYTCEVLGEIWTRRGDPAAAQAAMQRVHALVPPTPQLWLLDARLAHALGERARCRQALARAAAMGLPPDELAAAAATLGA